MRTFVLATTMLFAGCPSSRPDAPAEGAKPDEGAARVEEPPPTAAPLEGQSADESLPHRQATGDPARAAAAVTDLGLSLVRKTPEWQRASFVLSPASIALALGMTQAGAAGATKSQLIAATGLNDEDHGWLTHAYASLAAQMKKDGHTLEVANRVYLQTGFELAPPYQELVKERYGAPIELLDFKSASAAARKTINAWVQRTTHDKIVDLLPPPAVDASTIAVLVNALYLAASWQQAFEPERTAPMSFHTLAGRAVELPMMRRKGDFAAARRDGVLVVELEYAGGSLVFDAVMPEDPAALPAFMKDLTAASLAALLGAVAPERSASLLLPRFTLETKSHSLVAALKALGVADLFGAADLSAMGPHMQGAAVSEIVHGARIEVDERGTVAAAATAVGISKSAAATIAIDRPFLFLVRDKQSGLVLFAGQFV